MKRLITVICIMTILAVFSAVFHYCNILPLKTDDLASEKYKGWSGVLRVWYCDSLKPGGGSVSGWLNRCANGFEKNYDGVYVQIYLTDTTAIENLCENGVIPPDIILFPPGLISHPKHLIPLNEEKQLLSGVKNSGVYNGITYAQPIALGGYCWVYNTDDLTSIPFDWSNSDRTVSSLPDSSINRWSCALAALCSGRYCSSENSIPQSSSFDLDLGLSVYEKTPEPISTIEPTAEELSYCNLPADFEFLQTAFSDFTSSRISVIPASQYEVRRLKDLSDHGKGPEWQAVPSGDFSFTDQIIFAAIVDKVNAPGKQALCESFISYILSEKCQQDIHHAGLFSSTGADSGYDNHDPLRIIEKALKEKPLYATRAFDTNDDAYFSSIVRKFLEKGCFTPELYNSLMGLLS